MIQIRRAAERGHANYGWLDTYHTFSFGSYRDPRFDQFRALRVMNEDRVQPGQGFGTHPHRDMEIVTYVLAGALEHRDSMGHGEVLRPGEFQRMSAGHGILHSEFNPSQHEPVHLYQIWLLPERVGMEPSYEQRQFPEEGRRNRFQLVASRDAAENSLRIYQDARILLANLDSGRQLQWSIEPGRHVWLQVLRGEVAVNDQRLQTSDGMAVSEEALLKLQADESAEVMLFDLA